MTNFLLTICFALTTLFTLSGQTLCDAGFFVVEGVVTDACDEPIANLSILAEGENGTILDSATTDAFGFYALCIESGETATITPQSPNDYLNGVSTFDEVVIERHILGQDLFTSPLQLIAADVNTTQTITSLDILLVQQLILQQISEFENSPSWKYVANSDDLTLETAFEAQFVHFIEDINTNEFDKNFTAVKMGDVNQLGCGAAITNTDEITLVNEFSIAPNPFEEATIVSFTLSQKSNVEVLVSDILGRELVRNNAVYSSGNHQFQLTTQSLPKSGIYLITLSNGNSQLTKRIIYN